jgi:hypothetical protein
VATVVEVKPENRWRGRFSVLKTTREPKRGLGADYFAYVCTAEKESLKLDEQVVVIRRFDTGEEPGGDEELRGEMRPPQMRARCRLTVPYPEMSAGQVRIDQTVRNALGMQVKPTPQDTVDLAPLHRSPARAWGERLGDILLRRRYLFMRVRKADPGDMEKLMARIPADSFRLLGVSSGEKVRISHPVPRGDGPDYVEKHCTLQAYPVPEEVVKRQKEGRGGLYDRYPNPDKLLDASPDLGSIYLDQAARVSLDLRTLEVVRVRRADTDAFFQRIRSFGLAVAAAAIAIIGVFPVHKTAVNGVKVLLVAFAVASVISILSLRASSYGTPD